MLHTYVYSTSPHSLSKGPRPPAWGAPNEREGDSERIRGIWSEASIGTAPLPQPDLKRVGPWRVDRQAVLGLGGGRGASWSGNRVVLWADWLTDWRLSGTETQTARVASLWAPQGPSVLTHCWKWVRQTQELSGEWSESVHSAEIPRQRGI